MTSYEALKRGISKEDPYAVRLLASRDTRISNNLSTAAWRQRNFLPILPGTETGLRPEDTVLYQNILRGTANTLGTPSFNDKELRRMVAAHEKAEYECPANVVEYDRYIRKYPQGGMPCALPSLPTEEAQALLAWVKAGAQGPDESAVMKAKHPQRTAATQKDPAESIAAWEAFFNKDDLKYQLVARYIYEHSFVANIYLEENPGEFYRLVRSATSAPEEIQQIVTETPQELPSGVNRVFYRLQKIERVIEAKTHNVWKLTLADIPHFSQIFFGEPWSLERLPGYDSINPFVVFQSIPTKARATFLIENARMIDNSIARGPICFIQMATYGVDEYYFNFFLKPMSDPSVVVPTLGLDSYDSFLSYKINWKSVLAGDNRWGEGKFREAFERTLRSVKPEGLGIDDIWDGDGKNPNALVAVYRHQYTTEASNSSVRQLTGYPRSVHLFSYAGHERAYYNEVVHYKYWGELKHKVDTWDWSTYLRTEAEDLFVSLLPNQADRDARRASLTGPIGRTYYWLFKDYAKGRPATTPPNYNEDQLLRAILAKLGPNVTGEPDTLNNWPKNGLPQQILPQISSLEGWEMGLRALTGRKDAFVRFVPNIAYIRINKNTLYSLTVNRGYVPNKLILMEKLSRDPKGDILTASRGLLGVAPELFFDLSFDQSSAFLRELKSIQNLDQWIAFANRYKVPRSSPKFWEFVDWVHGWQAQNMGVEAAIIDVRYYDKGDLPF